MINDLINHTIANLQSAFFLIIPVLLLLALFGKNVFKHNKAFYFLLTAGIVALMLRIVLVFTVNELTGRHYLPVVIICVCFAPAGLYCLKKLRLKVNFDIIIILAMILILAGSAVKTFKITKKEFLNKFALCLKPFDSEDTILLSLTGVGRRINEKLSGKIKEQGTEHKKRSFYYWLDFFEKFEKASSEYKNIFVIARERKTIKNTDDSLESLFRNYYMMFPFDLVKKYDYRQDTYLLYRYNHEISRNTPKTTCILPEIPEYKAKISPKKMSRPVRILLLEPNAPLFYKNDALLKTTLKKSGLKTEIVSLYDFAPSELHFGYWNILTKINVIKDGIKQYPKPFDIVLINCGYSDVYYAGKRWRINTEAQKMKEELNTFINDIKQLYPDAFIGIALPIAPAPAPACYDIGRYKKQNHYALCKNIYNSLINKEKEKIYILPLYQNIDSEKDYQLTPKDMQARGIKYWYPLALSKTGKQKNANTIANWIIYIMR